MRADTALQAQAAAPHGESADATDPEGARRQKMNEESAALLALAVDLKTEVGKTNKDVLSLGVIRKAEEIEKLAHALREKVRRDGGAHEGHGG